MPQADDFPIPYRISNGEELERAGELLDRLRVPARYRRLMRDIAATRRIHPPPAMLAAKGPIVRDFCVIRAQAVPEECEMDELIRAAECARTELPEAIVPILGPLLAAGANPLESLAASHPRVADFVAALGGSNVAAMHRALGGITALIRDELLTLIRTGRTARLATDELKRLLVARTLFEPANGDILAGLRDGEDGGLTAEPDADVLAELLFVRIPRMTTQALWPDPAVVAKKVRAKLAKAPITERIRSYLHAHFDPGATTEGIAAGLDRLDGLLITLPMEEPARRSLRSFLASLRENTDQTERVFDALFMAGDLPAARKIHLCRRGGEPVPGGTVRYRVEERLTLVARLAFYPTKDLMDLFKGEISGDCTGLGLGRTQLLTAEFFNIRIFRQEGNGWSWLGNIYMLDFVAEHGFLLVDRIQISRDDFADAFVDFFDHLREAFEALFAEVGYRRILFPVTAISNYGMIQEALNRYRTHHRMPGAKLPHGVRIRSGFASYSHAVAVFMEK